jgi:hypothetical protein
VKSAANQECTAVSVHLAIGNYDALQFAVSHPLLRIHRTDRLVLAGSHMQNPEPCSNGHPQWCTSESGGGASVAPGEMISCTARSPDDALSLDEFPSVSPAEMCDEAWCMCCWPRLLPAASLPLPRPSSVGSRAERRDCGGVHERV